MGRHAVADLLSAMFDYGIDLRKRRVFLQCGIEAHENPGQNIAEMVIRGLLFLDKTVGEIELWINTPGGDVDDMFGIYDVIQSLENNVATIGHGQIASAGGLILAAGSKDLRYATPNAVFMCHEFQDGVTTRGTRLQKIHLEQKELLEEKWAKLMGRASGRKKTASFWLNKIQNEPEYWLDAKGMKTHGVIDDIWPPDPDDPEDDD